MTGSIHKVVEWWERNLTELHALADDGGFISWIRFNRICKENIGTGRPMEAYNHMDYEARAYVREEIRLLWHEMKEGEMRY